MEQEGLWDSGMGPDFGPALRIWSSLCCHLVGIQSQHLLEKLNEEGCLHFSGLFLHLPGPSPLGFTSGSLYDPDKSFAFLDLSFLS